MIIRARHDKSDPYFRFRRATAQDARLSWAARGMLAYLFSKPDDWEINAQAMMREGDLGRDGLYRVLGELREAGYVVRRQERREDGTLGRWMTDVHETPKLDKIETPLPALPDPAQPLPVQPDPVKPEHTYKEKVQIRELTEKEKQQQHARAKRGDKRAAAAAAAAGEKLDKAPPPASRYSREEIERYIRATKPHKAEGQVGGLVRHLERNGEEDEEIAAWLGRQEQAQARATHSPTCALCQGTGWQVVAKRGARACPGE